VVFSNLFDRLSGRLRGILCTLAEHGRHFGSQCRVAPLQIDLFRSEHAQYVVRANSLLSLVSLRRPSRFFRKTAVIDELVGLLQQNTREIVAGITEGTSLSLPEQWQRLEVLHHDLNICLCETTIVLKSFFCALPSVEILPFRKRLLALAPVTDGVPAGPPERFVSKMASTRAPQSAAQPALTAADDDAANPAPRRLHR